VTGAAGLARDELAEIREIALAQPELAGRLISPAADVTGVNVTLQLPGEDPMELFQPVTAAREMAAALEARYPGLEVRLSGVSMLNNAFAESGFEDMKTLIPLMNLVLILTMVLLLRSVTGTVATVAVIGLSSATAMGLAGWYGVLLEPVSLQATTMILTMAIADSVHILVTMLGEMRSGRTKTSALAESLRVNFLPVALTSVTTAIGFLSMNFSDSPPLNRLGTITAVGVGAALVLSLSFLPALMSILPVRVKVRRHTRSGTETVFARLGDFVVSRHRSVLIGATAIALALVAMVPINQTSDEFVRYFDESIEFRRDTDFAIERLTGIYQFQLSLDSGEPGGISKPAYLATLDQFSTWLREQPEIVRVSSLSDTLRRLNKNMLGDDPAEYRLPDNRELAAQYLLLYEMSLPYGLDLNNTINVDKSSSRVVATTGDIATREFMQLAGRAESWLRANAPVEMHARATGPTVMFSRITERNGTAVAFLLISLVLVLALRNLRIGALSIIPNLIPAAMAFGAWGLLVGKVGFAVSVVAAMTMGIVVDDSVHFLTKYLRARREKNFDAPDAVRYAFTSVGKALWVTSMVLVAGFAVLAQSTFKQNSDMGLLAAVTIVCALLADFFLLPALLILLDRKSTAPARVVLPATAPSLPGGEPMLSPVAVTDTPAFPAPRHPRRRYLADFMSRPSQTRKKRRTEMNPTMTTKRLGLVLTLLFATLAALPTSALTPEARGLEIAVEADRRDLGFEDFAAELTMTLRNRHGEQSTRRLHSTTLEQQSDGDKSLVVFDSPPDIDGTALLTFSHKTGNDDQWLYLPALKRVKRISSSNKSGPFVGSEFAYEDISSQEVEEYSYKFPRDETLDGIEMHVIERYPNDTKSGYTRQVIWLDQQELRPWRIDFFDRKDSLLKTLTYSGYQQYVDRYWRPDRMEMINHQTGKSTLLLWENYEFRNGLAEGDFNRAALARAR
jgi:predicted RND superfamily exporter protein/outer membrane lipoprotein-sorting protein